jgi:hypothetical protein
MTVKQAIKVLKKHNSWRRGGRASQQDPKKIGEAIDVAIAIMEAMLVKEPSLKGHHIKPKRHE